MAIVKTATADAFDDEQSSPLFCESPLFQDCGVTVAHMSGFDVPAAARLESRVFKEPTQEDVIEALRYKPEAFCRVVHYRQQHIGHLLGCFVRCPEIGDHFRFLSIAVHPLYQRRGIGSLLIRSAKIATKARFADRLVEIVHEENLAAQKFFRRNGFQATEVIRETFPDGRDGYLMEFDIDFSG